MMSVCYRTHNASYCQTVEIIINKDQNTKHNCGKFRTYTCVDLFAGPSSECGGAAGLVHHTYHRSQDNQEDQDSYVIAVRKNLDDSSLKNLCYGSFEFESGIKQCSYYNSHKQRTVYFFCDQRKDDRYKRWKQCPDCCIQSRLISLLRIRSQHSQGTCQCAHEYHCHNRQCCSCFFTHFSPPFSGTKKRRLSLLKNTSG